MPRPPYLTPENFAEKLSGWLREIARHARPRNHLKFSLEESALLVIDVQNYFCSPRGRRYISSSPVVLDRIGALVSFWRRSERPVFFTQHCHRSAEELGMFGEFFEDYIRCGEWDSLLWEGLGPISEGELIRKDSYDAFYKTGLEERLRAEGVTQVVVCGFVAHLCCETTVRSAFVRGFRPYFPADATASWREIHHFSALLSAASGFAVVELSDKFIEK